MANRKTQRRTKQGAQGGAPASRPGAEPIHAVELREWTEGEAGLYANVAKAHGLDLNDPAHRSLIEIAYRQSRGDKVRFGDVLKGAADRRSWERNTKRATEQNRLNGRSTRDNIG
jgi:hypothetical protein